MDALGQGLAEPGHPPLADAKQRPACGFGRRDRQVQDVLAHLAQMEDQPVHRPGRAAARAPGGLREQRAKRVDAAQHQVPASDKANDCLLYTSRCV